MTTRDEILAHLYTAYVAEEEWGFQVTKGQAGVAINRLVSEHPDLIRALPVNSDDDLYVLVRYLFTRLREDGDAHIRHADRLVAHHEARNN